MRRVDCAWLAVASVWVLALVFAPMPWASAPVATAASGTPGLARASEAQTGLSLARVSEHGSILGRVDAPVTLVVFGDLQCPACDPFFLELLPKLLGRWVQTGRVRIEYRSLQTATRNRHEFVEEAIAASAAGAQGAEWLFVEAFLRAHGEEGTEYATEEFLDRLALQLPGLDVAKWKADRADPRHRAQVIADERLAGRHHIDGTPGFLLGRTGRTLHTFEPFAYSARVFDKAFVAVLRRR
jgi:protein-disulfide isomerase